MTMLSSMGRHRSHAKLLGDGLGNTPGSRRSRWQGMLLWVGLTAVTAVVGSLASAQAGDFYGALQRPSWSPPAWLFGPVWTSLYLLMTCAAVLVHRRLGLHPKADVALRLYALALLPNALWSWTFFHWHQGALSLAVIACLWLLLVATVTAFRSVRPLAAALMVPVTLWVGFAALLNLALWRMNAGLL
jgi:translocator protein